MGAIPLHLHPEDVLFFRDGRPSAIGTDHELKSLFPPYPSTLYGALRTWRLVEAGVPLDGLNQARWAELPEDLVGEIGEWDEFGSLALRGPWLVKDGRPLVPAPADLGVVAELVNESTGEILREKRVVRYLPVELPGGWSHGLLPLLPREDEEDPDQKTAPAAGWWLTAEGLAAWRRGETPEASDLVPASDLWLEEPRTGVGLQGDQRTSQDTLLYTFAFVRLLPGVALGLEVEGMELPERGALRLGGERRVVTWEIPENPPSVPPFSKGGSQNPQTARTEDEDPLLAITLVTPTVTREGSRLLPLPPFEKGGTQGGFSEFRLVAAAVPGSLPLGGWDIAHGRPKPLRRGLPAGSVFYYQAPAGTDPAAAARELDWTCLSTDFDDSLARQGFGLAVAGLVPRPGGREE